MAIMRICWFKLWKLNFNPRNEQYNIYKMQATIRLRSYYDMPTALLSFANLINSELESIYAKFT